MKINTLVLIFTLCFSGIVFGKDRRALRVGYVAYPPFAYYDQNDHLTGTVVEKFKNATYEEFDSEFAPIPISRVADTLNSGLIDVYLTYFYSPERAKKVSYGQVAMIVHQALCSYTKLESLDHLHGKIIIRVKDTHVPQPLNVHNNEILWIDIPYGKNYIKRSVQLLKRGRADFVLLPDTSYAKDYNLSCFYLPNERKVFFVYPLKSTKKRQIEKLLKRNYRP